MGLLQLLFHVKATNLSFIQLFSPDKDQVMSFEVSDALQITQLKILRCATGPGRVSVGRLLYSKSRYVL